MLNITFVPDIDFVLKKAWSMRIFFIIAILSGTVTVAEVVLASSGDTIANLLPPGLYPLLVGILSILGMYFRTVLQQKTNEVVKGDPAEPDDKLDKVP
jgi:hypothetical protein